MSAIKWWLGQRLMKPSLLIHDIWLGILHRTTKKFNVIRLSRLNPGYYDVDLRMLHANFQLLQDFVEKEKPFDQIDWEADEQHRHASEEIKTLYHWWTAEYPTRKLCVEQLKDDERPHGLEMWTQGSGGMIFGNKEARLQEVVYPRYEAALKLDRELEEKWRQEEEDNLIRLMKIRNYLWT